MVDFLCLCSCDDAPFGRTPWATGCASLGRQKSAQFFCFFPRGFGFAEVGGRDLSGYGKGFYACLVAC